MNKINDTYYQEFYYESEEPKTMSKGKIYLGSEIREFIQKSINEGFIAWEVNDFLKRDSVGSIKFTINGITYFYEEI